MSVVVPGGPSTTETSETVSRTRFSSDSDMARCPRGRRRRGDNGYVDICKHPPDGLRGGRYISRGIAVLQYENGEGVARGRAQIRGGAALAPACVRNPLYAGASSAPPRIGPCKPSPRRATIRCMTQPGMLWRHVVINTHG